ncbi:MAG: hybrid sensor histidine kinase/response regulator [Proteobacteria bacterium]|nr:hybrid sensor histidine kinase/response regulator [Pseudomonadota bacterium]
METPHPGGRLVVVDDEPVILTVLQSVLDGEPWDIVYAQDGASAVAAMAEGVDVLLTDKNLPDINGLDLVRHAREKTPDAEAILLTGYASLETAIEAVKLDLFDYIVKPPRDIFEVAKKVRAAFERQRMRRENRRLLADLSEKNAELTTALDEVRRAQGELVQSEKLAGIGTLAAGVAHEISSPLFGVMGLAEAIVDESDLDEIHEHAREIVSYSRSIREIVVGLTGYARDAQTVHDVACDMAAAARDACRLVAHSAAARESQLEVRAEGSFWVLARAPELQQVFVNLVRNAAEASGAEGQVLVTLSRLGESVVASVEDTGPGLPAGAEHQVFDPFFTTKAPGEGTGLGLNIVYRIVTRYQGTIVAENREDGGARFVLRLPATEAP